ncbi:hypothetical protein SmJEL517_g04167 [Synchytrium microbalum]|uniref:Major facilitator superfamily (MFS) profile domain-containing protein n=1 Tax=Synchytrium microbalum TaxID=1806994 RepID=A0A507C198_9FUNG|nr:uncharacterized protein SmJEL517_g04167 [Synchytrium microbalum]TPX32829.1 hypothetical protein SmJEL517_g04167 [Synchytrium microbalum]
MGAEETAPVDEKSVMVVKVQDDDDPARTMSNDEEQAVPKVAAPVSIGANMELGKFQFVMVLVSLVSSMFLFALDTSIISTAIPTIASEFQSLDLVPWLGTGYYLAATSTSPLYGRFADVFGRKPVFLVAVFLFELGSLIAGLSTSMIMLIVGRTICGLGGGGIFSLVFIIVSDIVSMRDRGKYTGLFSMTFTISSVIGPLLGGVFTEKATWRWVFFINIPFGILAMTLVAIFLPRRASAVGGRTMMDKLRRIDYLGSLLLILCIVSLLIPLQSGIEWGWSAPQTIALFVLSAVFLIAFIVVENVVKEPVVPPKVFQNVTVVASFALGAFTGMAFLGLLYYVSIYFQVTVGDSATTAGLKTIPFVFGVSIISLVSGIMISVFGIYRPFLWCGGVILTGGAVMMSFMNATSPLWFQSIAQLLAGVGVGLVFGARIIAVQAAVSRELIAVAVGLTSFFQQLGSVVGVATVGAIFQDLLVKNLARDLPTLNPQLIANNPQYVKTLPSDQKAIAISAYVSAIDSAWRLAIAFSILVLICSLFIKNYQLGSSSAQKKKEAAAAKASDPSVPLTSVAGKTDA